MTELRDKMPDRNFPLQLPEGAEKGLDRCIRTIVSAVMALRDCNESDSDIAKALNAVNTFGPLEVIKRMQAAERETQTRGS